LLRSLLVFIPSYLKLQILDASHLRKLCLGEQGYLVPGYFSKPEGFREQKRLGKTVTCESM
jgi:hypothetical protein